MCIAFPSVPSEAPRGVTVTRSSDGRSMVVSWEPLTLTKAKGFPFYIVSYTFDNAVRIRRGTSAQITVYKASSVLITGLDPFSDYQVTVTVSNYGNSTGKNMAYEAGVTSIAVKSESVAYTATFYGGHLPPPPLTLTCTCYITIPRSSFSSGSYGSSCATVLLCVLVSYHQGTACPYSGTLFFTLHPYAQSCNCCRAKAARRDIYVLNEMDYNVKRLKEGGVCETDMAQLDKPQLDKPHPDRQGETWQGRW